MTAKMIDIVPMRQRPAIWAWSSSSVSVADERVKRVLSCGPAPIVLASTTPLMDRPSSIWVCMSASVPCAFD